MTTFLMQWASLVCYFSTFMIYKNIYGTCNYNAIVLKVNHTSECCLYAGKYHQNVWAFNILSSLFQKLFLSLNVYSVHTKTTVIIGKMYF